MWILLCVGRAFNLLWFQRFQYYFINNSHHKQLHCTQVIYMQNTSGGFFFFFFLKEKLFLIAVEQDCRDLISWKCRYCFPGFVLSDFVSHLALLILPEPNNWLSLFNSLLASVCPCTWNLKMPKLSTHIDGGPSVSCEIRKKKASVPKQVSTISKKPRS